MIVPIFLITLGSLLLLNNLDPARFDFARTWPVILIVIGLVKIVEYFGRAAVSRNQNGGRRHVSKAYRASEEVRPVAGVEADNNQTEKPR